MYAVLSVNTELRLSEPVLSEGIKLFYQKENLIPTGISLEAVEALTDKMALGLKKCVEKFKRTWRESPHASKLKNLTALKARLTNLKLGMVPPPLPCAEQVEEIAAANPSDSKVDWASLGAKLAAFKKKALPEQAGRPQRPVATPARSFALPPCVVESLRASAMKLPQPIAVDGEADDEAPAVETRKPKASNQKHKKVKKGKKKVKASENGTSAEDEEALSLVKTSSRSGPGEPQLGTTASAGAYVPGEFNKKRLEFIKRVRSDESTTFKEASARWMTSQDRVDLLAGMPWSELKKRRFL